MRMKGADGLSLEGLPGDYIALNGGHHPAFDAQQVVDIDNLFLFPAACEEQC